MNEAVCMNNRVTMNGVGKRLVRPFKRQEFWKCVGYIIQAVTYGKKGHKVWSEVPKSFGKYENPKLRRYFRGNTDLYKLCCAHYRHFTSMLAIELFYFTQLCSFHGCLFEYLPLFLHLQVCGISLTRFKEFRKFWPCYFFDPLVKGTDNFWKIRGLIDGFNGQHRKIDSGVGKTADESMSAIRLLTNPKGDLPH